MVVRIRWATIEGRLGKGTVSIGQSNDTYICPVAHIFWIKWLVLFFTPTTYHSGRLVRGGSTFLKECGSFAHTIFPGKRIHLRTQFSQVNVTFAHIRLLR